MSMESEPTEVNCSNCVGACCRAPTALMLDAQEAYRHRRSMKLEPIVKPKNYDQRVILQVESLDADGRRVPVPTAVRVKSRYGFYMLTEDCGYLTDDGECSNYDDRPKSCKEYEMGSELCLNARGVYGLDGHEAQVEITSRTDTQD